MALWDGLITPFNVFISPAPQGRGGRTLTGLVHSLIGMRWGLWCDDPPSEMHPQRCLRLEYLPSLSSSAHVLHAILPQMRRLIECHIYKRLKFCFQDNGWGRPLSACGRARCKQFSPSTSFEGNYRGVRFTLWKEWCEEVRGEARQLFTPCLFAVGSQQRHYKLTYFVLIYHADCMQSVILYSVCSGCSLVHTAVW